MASVFVTVGSRDFQFDRLLKAVDEAIEAGQIDEEVFAQTGSSNYVPRRYGYSSYLSGKDFTEHLKQCDYLITHGGTGSIVNASKMKKKIIAVPRLEEYGEAIDNHQVQLVEQFAKAGLLEPCLDPGNIGQAFIKAKANRYGEYSSNTHAILNDLSNYLEGL